MKAILTDITKCIGCSRCVMACKEVNELNMDIPRRWQSGDGLSAANWTSILRIDDQHFVRKQCRHCVEPACATACPVAALHKTPEGAVIYDSKKCIGCRYCMLACPYGIPRYDWDEPVPYIRKCILCYDRIKVGKQPACTEICPVEATIFGDRDRLIAEANKRIKASPDKYIHKIWGEKEVGGTNIIYISDIDLKFLTNGKDYSDEPLPDTTSLAMNSVPFVFLGMGTVVTGLHWIIKRRQKLMDENKNGGADNG